MAHESHNRTFAEMMEGRDYERAKTPKIIGTYRMGKTIGSGAFCKVKTATHLVTKEKFAIKILQPQAPQNWAEVEREIEILRQIQHPNIIRVQDVLWSENKGMIHKFVQFNELRIQAVKIYIVVELAQGGELWHHISKNGPMSEDMCRKLFRQMVSGLEYCHMHLICHRDLKLENILLDDHNNVKINDFGLSNFIRPGHSMHTFCGTLAYAAPEILSQQAYVGFFVDIWSLGIILFAMLAGDVPWALDDETRKSVELSNLLTGKFRLPIGISLSPECVSLLQIMLQPNPKNRATLAQIRTHPWTNKGFHEPPVRVFENYPPVTDIEEPIVQQISLLGLNPAKARKSILSNEPCPALCLYHTLHKKQSKRILPPLVRPTGEPRSPNGTRFATVSPSSAPPNLGKHVDVYDDGDDLERKIENSLKDDSEYSRYSPSGGRYINYRNKTSSAPNSPTSINVPPSPFCPTITTTTPPPSSPRNITSPRTITSAETRRKMLTHDSNNSNRNYLDPVSPSSRFPSLSAPSSPSSSRAPPPPSFASPSTPYYSSSSPSSSHHATSISNTPPISSPSYAKRSTGSPKTAHSSPKSPSSYLSSPKDAPFGGSGGGVAAGGSVGIHDRDTHKEREREKEKDKDRDEEGEDKKKPIFKSLLSKLRGSKLAPLEV